MGREGRAEQGDRLHARARRDAGLHRRARRRRPRRDARRDGATWAATPRKINPLVPAELVIDHSVQVDVVRHAPTRSASTPSASSSATRSATRSCAGARTRSTTSRSSRPDTGIVHQVNLEYLARVVFVERRGRAGLPRHARRHRLAHDDGQRPRRARLGRRRHRGRGGDARPADVDADPAGHRLPARTASCPRARPRPTSCSPSPSCCASKGVVGKFVEFYGAGVSRLPLADRATIGNMSPEFGSTCAIFPIDAETLRYLRVHRPPAGADRAGRGLRQGAGPLARRATPRSRRTRDTLELDLGDVVPSIAGPERPQDRVALTRRQEAFREALAGLRARAATRRRGGRCDSVPGQRPAGLGRARQRRDEPPSTQPTDGARRGRRASSDSRVPVTLADGTRDRARPRPRRDRRDHELHEHLEPVGDARRRACSRATRRARPDDQAVGQDVARARLEGRHRLPRARRPHRRPRGARLQPRRLRLHDLHRQLRPAAGGDLGRHRGGRPRGRARCCRATATSRAASTPT